MSTQQAIAMAVRKALSRSVRNGDIDADSSWSEISECLRQTVPDNKNWPQSMVNAEITLVAQDMRPE